MVIEVPYTGREVVAKHKAAVSKCRGKSGWDALECIVDSMQEEYKKTT
ncbi:MAG: hypothetical protein QXQ91_04455 [Nanopusillaceae archaeon]